MTGKVVEKPDTMTGGMQNDAATLENNLAVPQMVAHKITHQLHFQVYTQEK